MLKHIGILALLGLSITGCAMKRYLPISPSPASIPVPTQQESIAKALDAAIVGLDPSNDLSTLLADKVVYVEVAGCLANPQSLDLARAKLEARLLDEKIKARVMVPTSKTMVAYSSLASGAEGSWSVTQGSGASGWYVGYAKPEEADFRLLLLLNSVGMDDVVASSGKTQRRFVSGKVAAQLFVIPVKGDAGFVMLESKGSSEEKVYFHKVGTKLQDTDYFTGNLSASILDKSRHVEHAPVLGEEDSEDAQDTKGEKKQSFWSKWFGWLFGKKKS